MESATGSAALAMSTSITATTTSTTTVATTTSNTSPATTATAIATTTTIISSTSNQANNVGSNTTSVLVANTNTSATGVSGGVVVANLAAAPTMQQSAVQQQTQQLLPLESCKFEDANNSSLASAISEGQRSLSGAPSASSSPILSPSGKMFGRNANGTMVATSRPSNEAEVTLYRVLQRASLLAYYDTLLEMGGDDVQQLYEAGEEEFLEIMALVGMASKPLHVRRLQKVLHEWASNPALFQGPLVPNVTASLCETPTKTIFIPETSQTLPRSKFPTYNPTPAFNPTPLISTAQTSSSSHLLTQICSPAVSVPVIQPHIHTSLPQPATLSTPMQVTPQQHTPGASTSHQVTSSSPQLTPVLTEMQVSRITLGAEKIARQLPQREPRAQTSKKRTSRELEQVMAMSKNDPRRMEEIRKYSAIYGRFDCKRRPEKPLTLHEVCVNEAAAQLCRLVPALLTRRDELFPLARQIVKDAGFGHSASIARYGVLLPQMQQSQTTPCSSVAVVDCESSDATALPIKRQRLSSTETTSNPDINRESTDDSRYNLFAMYQKFAAKPPFDLTELSKFASCNKADYDDNDNDSRFSFSNSNSPLSSQTPSQQPLSSSSSLQPMPGNGLQSNEGDNSENISSIGIPEAHSTATSMPYSVLSPNRTRSQYSKVETTSVNECTGGLTTSSALMGGVQVLSAAGGHIIAVTNPALVLSPTLNDVLSLKRENDSPDI